ncbi:transglutaminase family protein [Inquilinus limosus]|uniref:transglutaminase family protein n=1 Tax=Inquilinus limosus TaxID=171674 RepID=UPI00041F026D|nr:transglutaminase family protein [Inquilinus limosus]
MRLLIRHETRYRYDSPVARTLQTLRLTPRSHDGQEVLRWRVVPPAGANLAPGEDAYGNIVDMLSLERPHDSLTLVVEGEVVTRDTNGIVTGAEERFPPAFYLRPSPLAHVDAALVELAEAAAAAGREPLALAHALMLAVRGRIAFRPGQTHAATTAAEALAAGVGVCQDHTHVFLACARHLGLPARYVGGYLLMADGSVEQAAGHAWAEAFIDGLGWVGFDAANGVCPTEHYVRVAVGLDYRDTAPVRGLRQGGGAEALEVLVRVGQSQTQAQA